MSKLNLQIFIYIIFTILSLSTATLPFFWDTTQLASKHAHFFYENNFSSIILPNSMDSGHIPAFGMYLALIWKIFGKSLLVSHLSMLPFILLAVFFTQKLSRVLFTDKYASYITLLILCDAAILAQFTLVSPDIWLVLFFVTALYALLSNKRILLTIAIAGLTLTSMRGMMCVAAICLSEWLNRILYLKNSSGLKLNLKNGIKEIFRLLPNYLPALIIAALFFGWHYYKTGWIAYHKDMPWYSSFEFVDFKGFLRNIIILIWRMFDNGRLIYWLILLFSVFFYLKKKSNLSENGKKLIVISCCVFIFLTYNALIRKNLSAHRYLIPIYITISLSALYMISSLITNPKKLKIVFGITLVFVLSGNFWVYPEKTSTGWDSILAYLPYQKLRLEMIDYIKKNNIPINEIVTAFPNHTSTKYIDLSDHPILFKDYNGDLKKPKYFFYSNIYTGLSDIDIDQLKKWTIIKKFQRLQVFVVLYQNPGVVKGVEDTSKK